MRLAPIIRADGVPALVVWLEVSTMLWVSRPTIIDVWARYVLHILYIPGLKHFMGWQ